MTPSSRTDGCEESACACACAQELASLRTRLAEAEDILNAIRDGDVDAVVVYGEGSERVYTLSGADRVYQKHIETMHEAAVTLSADGIILYCNTRTADLLGLPLERVIGSTLRQWLPAADRHAFDTVLLQARNTRRGQK